MKNDDGVTASGSKAVKRAWERYFECLMNEKTEGQAVVLSMGIGVGRGLWCVQGEVRKEEVRKAIERLKVGKAAGIDGITA